MSRKPWLPFLSAGSKLQTKMFKVGATFVVLAVSCNAFFLNGPSQHGTVNPSVDVSSECIALAAAGNCSFFDCFEQRFRCGSHGYALAYGGKYCKRLEAAKSSFTDAGDVFIEKMRQCELTHLLPFYRQDHLNCQDFYDQSFVVMGNCYMESGYCDVVLDNFDGFMHTFDKNDFLNLKMFSHYVGKLFALNHIDRTLHTRPQSLRTNPTRRRGPEVRASMLINQVMGAAEKCGSSTVSELIKDFMSSTLSG